MRDVLHNDFRAGGLSQRIQCRNKPLQQRIIQQCFDRLFAHRGDIGKPHAVRRQHARISAATGAQIKELLKKLPDGMTFELTLEKDDN